MLQKNFNENHNDNYDARFYRSQITWLFHAKSCFAMYLISNENYYLSKCHFIQILSCLQEVTGSEDLESAREKLIHFNWNLEVKFSIPTTMLLKSDICNCSLNNMINHLSTRSVICCCVACLILSATETRDRAVSFFWGNGLHEVVSHCLPCQGCSYCDACRIQAQNPCVKTPHA